MKTAILVGIAAGGGVVLGDMALATKWGQKAVSEQPKRAKFVKTAAGATAAAAIFGLLNAVL